MTLSPIDPTNPTVIDENGVALDPAFVAAETDVEVSGDTGRSDVEDDDAPAVDSPDVDDDAEPIDA